MFDIVKNIFLGFWMFFKWPLIIISVFLFVMFTLCLVNILILKLKGNKREYLANQRTIKKISFIRKLFIDFPKQYASDYFDRPIGYFRHQGLIIFTGRQGGGKTISMVKQLLDYQKEYPECKVLTNFNYLPEDEKLDDWRKLIDFKNGKKGVVAALDELQNWFSCNQSKNFPPEMLAIITQNRKNRRVILGTAQSFNLLSKAIRTQTVEVRECITLAGCFTFVHKKYPILNAEGDVEKWKNRGYYCFVHSKEIREAYDTYKIIENLKDSGFKDPIMVPETKVINVLPAKKKGL